MDFAFSSDDIATEILSRLPAKDIAVGRCVSKRWNGLTSSASFLRIHSQRSEDTSGLILQKIGDKLDNGYRPPAYTCVNDEDPDIQATILDFLPEKVVVMASCNGLLCCRSLIDCKDLCAKLRKRYRNGSTIPSSKELVVYVCNPTTKGWIALRPTGCDAGATFGLAFYPFGDSMSNRPYYKLVSRPSKFPSNSYSVVMYSSKTGKWTTPKEVCDCPYRINWHKQRFVGSRFHWLTWNDHMITFNVETEVSGVVKLPVSEIEWRRRVCLGSSEGYIHYIFVNRSEVQVWMLKDYCKPVWLLKHRLNLVEFAMEYYDILVSHPRDRFKGFQCLPEILSDRTIPLSFHEEVLFFSFYRSVIYSYNFKTRKLREHCYTSSLEYCFFDVIPHSVRMAGMHVLNEG